MSVAAVQGYNLAHVKHVLSKYEGMHAHWIYNQNENTNTQI